MNLINTDIIYIEQCDYQSHAEPNVYYQPQFTTNAIARQNTSPVMITQQNFRDETSEESSGIQL